MSNGEISYTTFSVQLVFSITKMSTHNAKVQVQ